MAQVLNIQNPAIALVKESLDILKQRNEIQGYKIKTRKNSILEIKDLYFRVIFNQGINSFELRCNLNGSNNNNLTSTEWNKMIINLDVKGEFESLILAEAITNSITFMSKDCYASGFVEEDRYQDEVLEKLKKKGWIQDYYQPSEESDGKGKDFIIIFNDRFIPIQIKSYREHQVRHKRLHGDIPSLVTKYKTPDVLIEKTMKIIMYFLEGKILHL